MAKKTEMESVHLAYIPYGCEMPVIHEAPAPLLEEWCERILGTDELILRPSVLGAIHLLCLKTDHDEPFNHFATALYLHAHDDVIGGNVIACRASFKRDEKGKVHIQGLTENDCMRLERASQKYFGNRELLEFR